MTANDVTLLLQHYVDNFRLLPWRSAPGNRAPDPYRVWLSEVMLQQTTVAAVIPRFERFLTRWPTLEALAAAREEDVLGEWAGLGYYARARNLIACARQAAANGGLPATAAELRALPGIGAYTAAAIAAIAFGEAAGAVDTNIERVLSRYLAIREPVRSELERAVVALIPEGRAGDTVQALMDLGATICTPRRPRCPDCPIRGGCAAFASGDPEAYPEKSPKAPRPHRHGIAWWTEAGGSVWLVRRPADGVLGGMAALPGDTWGPESPGGGEAIATVRHSFTHFTLDLAIVESPRPRGEGWWQPIHELDDAGLPTLYRRAVEAVLDARRNGNAPPHRERLEEAPAAP